MDPARVIREFVQQPCDTFYLWPALAQNPTKSIPSLPACMGGHVGKVKGILKFGLIGARTGQ